MVRPESAVSSQLCIGGKKRCANVQVFELSQY